MFVILMLMLPDNKKWLIEQQIIKIKIKKSFVYKKIALTIDNDS